MTVRNQFVERFGEENATRIEEASLTHTQDPSYQSVHKDDDWGSDPFQYHLMTCVSRRCFEHQGGETHGFTFTREEVRQWAVEEGRLHEYDGDVPDYIGLLAGAYANWINWEQSATPMPAYWGSFEAEDARWRGMSREERTREVKNLAEEAMRMLNPHNDEGK